MSSSRVVQIKPSVHFVQFCLLMREEKLISDLLDLRVVELTKPRSTLFFQPTQALSVLFPRKTGAWKKQILQRLAFVEGRMDENPTD